MSTRPRSSSAAMAWCGELVQAGVGHDHDVVPDGVPEKHGRQCPVENAVQEDPTEPTASLSSGRGTPNSITPPNPSVTDRRTSSTSESTVCYTATRADPDAARPALSDEHQQHQLTPGGSGSRPPEHAWPACCAAGGDGRSSVFLSQGGQGVHQPGRGCLGGGRDHGESGGTGGCDFLLSPSATTGGPGRPSSSAAARATNGAVTTNTRRSRPAGLGGPPHRDSRPDRSDGRRPGRRGIRVR